MTWNIVAVTLKPVSEKADENTAEFANSVDFDEVAHKEPTHLDLRCLPSSL